MAKLSALLSSWMPLLAAILRRRQRFFFWRVQRGGRGEGRRHLDIPSLPPLEGTSEMSKHTHTERERERERERDPHTHTHPPTHTHTQAVPACKKCVLFGECLGHGLEHPIWELPRLTGKRFFEVAEYGLEVRNAPEHLLTPAQKRFRQCVLAGKMLVDKKAVLRALETMAPPFYYLDFESVSPLDPPFAGLAPWETVVTQYSLHVCPEVGAPLQHMEYLAVPDRDCREELARYM